MIVFHALTDADLERIVDLLLADLARRLAGQDLALELTRRRARALIVREGTDPAYGARPLKRTIQRLVENPLARALVAGRVQAGRPDHGRRRPRFGHDRVLDRGRDRGHRGRLATRCRDARTPTRPRSAPVRGRAIRSTCRRPSASAATATWSTRRRGARSADVRFDVVLRAAGGAARRPAAAGRRR